MRPAPASPRVVPSVRLRISLVAVVALVGVGCSFDVAGDQAFAAPGIYREWWNKTEACSGLSGDFERIRWEVVQGRGFKCASGRCAAHWESDHHIYIASDWISNEMVVRHEMLHELVGRAGHPNPPFGTGCPLTWSTWEGKD